MLKTHGITMENTGKKVVLSLVNKIVWYGNPFLPHKEKKTCFCESYYVMKSWNDDTVWHTKSR